MDTRERFESTDRAAIDAARHIYHAWDDALGKKDLEAALRPFVEKVFKTQPALRQRQRRGFFTDGSCLMWEYPRQGSQGEQMDLVEVMELKDGRIQHHRVYWGWLGVKVLEENRHRAD